MKNRIGSILSLVLILILGRADLAVAEDTFGMWTDLLGEWTSYLPTELATSPFTLYVALHDPTVYAVGGYEVGIGTPAELLVLATGGPNGWTNFGDATNHLVGYTAPLPATGDPFTILGQLDCLMLDPVDAVVSYHGADPPSIPGHDGPVIADGANPDHLIACGYVNGTPDVFVILQPDAVRSDSWTGVKSLFD